MAFTNDSVMVNNVVHTEQLMGDECRICLKPCTEVCQLFQNNGGIPEKLMAIGAVQVQEGDGLPASICLSCNHLLDVSYDFKCQIQNSDIKLRQILKLPILQDNNMKVIMDAMPDVNLKKDNDIEIYSHDLITSNNTAIINNESPISHDQSNRLCSSMSEDSYTSCDKQEQLMLSEDNKTSENVTDNNREVTIKDDVKNEMSLEDNQDVLKQLLGMDNQDVETCSDDEEKPLISRTTGYKCSDCIKSFATHTALMEHAKLKHHPHYYLCVLCDKYLSDKAKLKKHMFTNHRMMDDETLQESNQDKKTNKVSTKVTRSGTIIDNTREKNKYICNICSREFKYHKPFLSHTKNHSACSEKMSDNVFDQSQNKKTNKQKDKISRENKSEDEDEEEDDDDSDLPIESLQCTQCGKLFATKRNLKRHISTHSGLKFNCTTCGKEFSRIDKLKDHEQSKHKMEIFGNTEDEDDDDEDNENKVNENSESRKKDRHNRPHQCSHCPKAFAQAQSLANHEERHKRAKDTQKRFLCEKCSKCFAQSGSLVAHMRTHTGHRPYVCKVCSRAFTKSTYLQLHLRTHSGEKPYICQYCSRAFARANTLARHITMHTGEAKYCCNICEKKFRRLTSLNEHMYTHTGQRPYACKLCNKRYNNAGSLYAHTKKCKAQQSSSGATTAFTVSTVDTTPQQNEASMPQLLIYSQRKLEEEPSVNQVMPTPQYLVANVHNQKTMSTNVIQSFTMEDPNVPNVYNPKQFKNYTYIYPNM